MNRYKIVIEYKGTNFVGWQKQDNGLSIQESIEKSIKELTKETKRNDLVHLFHGYVFSKLSFYYVRIG